MGVVPFGAAIIWEADRARSEGTIEGEKDGQGGKKLDGIGDWKKNHGKLFGKKSSDNEDRMQFIFFFFIFLFKE